MTAVFLPWRVRRQCCSEAARKRQFVLTQKTECQSDLTDAAGTPSPPHNRPGSEAFALIQQSEFLVQVSNPNFFRTTGVWAFYPSVDIKHIAQWSLKLEPFCTWSCTAHAEARLAYTNKNGVQHNLMAVNRHTLILSDSKKVADQLVRGCARSVR